MNLTEPQAGSDVGAVRTRAEPRGDGSFAVTGQKIFISWGDHDMAENVCHLVLARLPDAAPGTRGHLAVPGAEVRARRRRPPGRGQRGAGGVARAQDGAARQPDLRDGVRRRAPAGWSASRTEGMAAMFTMMNNARLGVGVEGLAQAEAALQAALGLRARAAAGADAGAGEAAIVGHADVRRMLATMAATVATARAICLDCALSIDMGDARPARRTGRRGRRFLTPIAKAFGTDAGCEVSALAMQVFGGMGYVEETGVAQFYRDVRVTAIYEGTNGIQAMDLVGRKLADGGAAARALLDEVAATAAAGGARGDGARGGGRAAARRRPTGCWRRRRTTASPGRRPTCAPSR